MDGDDRTVYGKYKIDKDISGSFHFKDSCDDFRDGIYVGARASITNHPFIGDISAIEIYTAKDDKMKDLPNKLKELVIDDQMYTYFSATPAKRKKII